MIDNYVIGEKLDPCGVAEVYVCTNNGVEYRLHRAQAPENSDLLAHEANVIQQLRTSPYKGKSTESFFSMLPSLRDSFAFGNAKSSTQVNIYDALEKGYVRLDDVYKAYPEGLDPRDMAWILRRLLNVIGYAHSRGVVHGAVLPHYILVGLGDIHEVVLTNWQYSAVLSDVECRILAVEEDYRSWYPKDLLDGKPADQNYDISMVALCCLKLIGVNPLTGLGADEHPEVVDFLLGCIGQKMDSNTITAFKLYKEFGHLAKQLWGERKYRPLHLTH